MIEPNLEKAVLDAIDSLGLDNLAAGGFWQPSASPDILKDLERDDVSAIVRVNAKPRRYDGFTSPKCEIQVNIVLAVLVDRAPDGAALALAAKPILDLIETWQRDIAAVKAAFAVQGFTPSGFRNDGGDASLDRQRKAWVMPLAFTVRGVVTPSTEEQQTQGATS